MRPTKPLQPRTDESLLINLTPHPIHIYPPDCPDRIEPGTIEPLLTIGPSPVYPPARIGEISLGTVMHLAADATEPSLVPIEYVEYCSHGGTVHPLPLQDEHEPHQTWYIVPLVVALQQTYTGYNRSDLLVPYRDVRNMSGSVIGCRQLASPV